MTTTVQLEKPTPLSETPGSDLTTEVFREYNFPNGAKVRIDKPKTLWVKGPPPGSIGGGSHRIVTTDGFSHYVAPGWVHIRFKVHEGQAAFTF